jgi:hypothetical protein
VERGVPLSRVPINLTELEDATEVAPLSNEKLVIRCLDCRALALERKALVRRERQRLEGLQSNTPLSIISVLKRAKNPLSGKGIATLAHLKYNSHFRGTLARLIQSGDIKRLGGLRSYVLGDRHLS